MDSAIAAWEDEGGTSTQDAFDATQTTNDSGTVLTGVLYAITIIVILAVVSRL
jgi:hypothetical protein